MNLDQHFCILCKQLINGLDKYVHHRSVGSCGSERRRISDQSGQSSDGEQDRMHEEETHSDHVPPVGYTGGKWKPGQADMYSKMLYRGYRILQEDAGEEAAGCPSLDPVADKIHNIRLSLSSPVVTDASTLIQEQRKCLHTFPFVCHVCPFYSSRFSSFTWHLNSCQHNGQKRLMEMRCQICSFTCDRMTDLIQHFNLERKGKPKVTRNSISRCNKKEATTSNAENKSVIENEYLKGTIFSCHIKRPFPCSLCDRTFCMRIAQRIHFRRHHSETMHAHQVTPTIAKDSHHVSGTAAVPAPPTVPGPFICPVCSSEHSTKGNLRQHVGRHAPDLRCPSCPRTFSVRADLLKHSAVHSDRKPFHCDAVGCTHSAKSLQTLRKHQKVHRSEKPFKCQECEFACRLSSNLKRHQRIHSKGKPYTCPHCDYRTGNQENLRKHILTSKKHKGLPVYCCDACSYGCNDFTLFAHHLKQLHQRTNIRSIFSITAA